MGVYATFIGEDGSLGYRNGKHYKIIVETFDGQIWVCCYPHKDCPYATMQALLKNWRFD